MLVLLLFLPPLFLHLLLLLQVQRTEVGAGAGAQGMSMLVQVPPANGGFRATASS